MSDTILKQCKKCGEEGDCIDGICFECSVRNSAPIKAVDAIINFLDKSVDK